MKLYINCDICILTPLWGQLWVYGLTPSETSMVTMQLIKTCPRYLAVDHIFKFRRFNLTIHITDKYQEHLNKITWRKSNRVEYIKNSIAKKYPKIISYFLQGNRGEKQHLGYVTLLEIYNTAIFNSNSYICFALAVKSIISKVNGGYDHVNLINCKHVFEKELFLRNRNKFTLSSTRKKLL